MPAFVVPPRPFAVDDARGVAYRPPMRTSFLFLVLVVGCGGSSSSSPPPAESETTGSEPVDTVSGTSRPSMTDAECTAQGGTVVGDIGDGAIHRDDYVCPSGVAPIGTVPVGIEGSVCCP
jgi:hypothetical protein